MENDIHIETDNDLLVVKYGSGCVSDENGINYGMIDQYADQIADIREDGFDVVVVSSGSIAAAEAIWGSARPGESMPSEQVLATMGSAYLSTGWARSLSRNNILAGQVLVTHHEIGHSQEGGFLRRVMSEAIANNVVLQANENDALSDEEIKKKRYGGDNDGLASHLAMMLDEIHPNTTQLCLLTDEVEGLLDDTGGLVDRVTPHETKKAIDWAWGDPNENGMHTKFHAAFSAAAFGIRTFIANPRHSFDDILTNDGVGTHFPPHGG